MAYSNMDLHTAKGVQKALADGRDLYNELTGEFYSASLHKMLGDGIPCVYGRADAGQVGAAFDALGGHDAHHLASADVASALEQATHSSPRKGNGKFPLSWKEAGRVARRAGWRELSATSVFGCPDLEPQEGDVGLVEAQVREMEEFGAWTRDLPFSAKRVAFEGELAAFGFDAQAPGNPATQAQARYLVSLGLPGSGHEVDVTAMALVWSGACSSKEVSELITRAESGEGASKLSALIGAAHERYKDAHEGVFEPVTERAGYEAKRVARVEGQPLVVIPYADMPEAVVNAGETSSGDKSIGDEIEF